jgi:FMN phosphatase YigB (HAD superfamily)
MTANSDIRLSPKGDVRCTMNNTNIKAIFFDLGNVLVRFDLAILEKGYAEYGYKPHMDIARYIMESDTGRSYMRGRINSSVFYEKTRRHFRMKISFGDFYRVWNSMFYPYPEMELIVRSVKEKYPEVTLVLISDTNEGHYRFIKENYAFLEVLDRYVLSYEVGWMKPDKRIYRKAIDASGSPARDIFYTDDRLDLIEKARTMGIRAYQFTGHEALLAQLAKFGLTNIPSPTAPSRPSSISP